MRIPITPLLMTVVLALPAAAQTQVPEGQCAALIEQMGLLGLTDESTVTDRADGCSITRVSVDIGSAARYDIEAITLTAPDLFDRLSEDLPPTQLDLAVTGIRVLPPVDDPLYTYVILLQSEPFNVHIGYAWDSETGDLHLTEASLTAGPDDRLAMSGTLSGLTEDAFADGRMGIEPEIQLRELTANIESRALFVNFIAAPLLYSLPGGEDPRPAIAQYKQEARAILQALPETLVNAESKSVLDAFIEALPAPERHYRFEASFPDGFNPLDMQSEGLEAILSNLSGVSISASTID